MDSCPRCRVDIEERGNFCFACGADLRDDADESYLYASPDPLVGKVVAERYRLLELVGRGGMGVVYKIEHVRMGKLMAMKLLHGELATDRDVVKRFKTEAHAVSRLSHPNTVQVFDFGRADGLMFLVMEFIDGVELARVVRQEGTLPFTRAAAVVVQVCASLAEAHDLGIIHRDLKPENVLLRKTREDSEHVKVLDFGLAKLRDGEERSETTHRGLLVGTPHYMAPEQIRGEDMDHRTDIYALGAMLYKLLSGDPPFRATTPVGVLTKHLTEPVPPLCERAPDSNVPAEMEAIVRRCLEKDPDDRYDSVDEIRDELLAQLADVEAVGLVPTSSGVNPRPSFIGATGAGSTRSRRVGSLPTAALRVGDRLIEISSRKDFDKYERSLRRKGIVSWIAAVVALLLAAGGIAWYATRLRSLPSEVESEPNDQPSQAGALLPGQAARGHIGKRLSLNESDRDWFTVVNVGAEGRVLRAELTGIPRMDLILQLFDRSVNEPIAESNAGGPGDPESITGVAVEGLDYFLLIREVWVHGRAPSENVSDEYSLQVELRDPSDHEGEPNDGAGAHTIVTVGRPMRGYVGRRADVDHFCVGGEDHPGRLSVEVVPPQGMQMVFVGLSGDARQGEDSDDGVMRATLGEDRCFGIRPAAEDLVNLREPYIVTVNADGAGEGASGTGDGRP